MPSIHIESFFYKQVHSNAVTELTENVITPKGLVKILQGHTDGVSFIDPVSGATFYDRGRLAYLYRGQVPEDLGR